MPSRLTLANLPVQIMQDESLNVIGVGSNGGYFEDAQNETQVGPVQVGLNATSHNLQFSLRSTGAGTVIWRIAEPAIWKL